jgi:hypothetical protein
MAETLSEAIGGGTMKLTQCELATLLEACQLQVHDLCLKAERAQHEVERFHFTVRAERLVAVEEKIQAAMGRRP